MKVIKKDGTFEDYSFKKIINAVEKSAKRAGVKLSEKQYDAIQTYINTFLENKNEVSVNSIHSLVENALARVSNEVASSYSGYRNWKKEMAEMMNTVVENVNKSMEERDRSNSNNNSLLFSSRRTNVSNILLTEMFEKYFLTDEERQATADGYIYVHDKSNRLIGTHNCCVVKMENIIDGGFWINGYFCKEPKDITNAVGVIGDIIVTAASAQYGGYSCAEIDTTLAKYCKKTYLDKFKHYKEVCGDNNSDKARSLAEKETLEELENSLQGLEFQLNTRESSRGDYPFVTFTFGKDASFWGRKVASTLLKVRRKGHGDKVKQKMIFPKLVYILRRDGANDDIFKEAIQTSAVALYPDYIRDDMPSPMGQI